jgi:hypothetical protein
MFNRKSETQNINDLPISTGVSVKERLKLFNSTAINYPKPENKPIITKVKTTINPKINNNLEAKEKKDEKKSIDKIENKKEEKKIEIKNKDNKDNKKEVKEDIKKVDDIKKTDEINNNKKINNKIKTEKDINKEQNITKDKKIDNKKEEVKTEPKNKDIKKQENNKNDLNKEKPVIKEQKKEEIKKEKTIKEKKEEVTKEREKKNDNKNKIENNQENKIESKNQNIKNIEKEEISKKKSEEKIKETPEENIKKDIEKEKIQNKEQVSEKKGTEEKQNKEINRKEIESKENKEVTEDLKNDKNITEEIKNENKEDIEKNEENLKQKKEEEKEGVIEDNAKKNENEVNKVEDKKNKKIEENEKEAEYKEEVKDKELNKDIEEEKNEDNNKDNKSEENVDENMEDKINKENLEDNLINNENENIKDNKTEEIAFKEDEIKKEDEEEKKEVIKDDNKPKINEEIDNKETIEEDNKQKVKEEEIINKEENKNIVENKGKDIKEKGNFEKTEKEINKEEKLQDKNVINEEDKKKKEKDIKVKKTKKEKKAKEIYLEDNYYKDEWEYDDDLIDLYDISSPEESEEEEIQYESELINNSEADKDTSIELKNKKNEKSRSIVLDNPLIETKGKESRVNITRTFTTQIDSKTKKKITSDLGFEILDTLDEEIQPSSTMNTSIESSLPENLLESINYEAYLSELKSGKKEYSHETFCEGFFLASFPKKNGQVIEKSSKFPASCGHQECSELPSMKPEIILKYPLKNTKNLEFNNLAATICFPTGIKMCYSEEEMPKPIEDYVTQITNQKGERLYMRTFHFYKKMSNIVFMKEYEVNSLKYNLSTFGDEYLFLKEEQYTEEITDSIQKNLDFCQELGSRDIVYVPHCLCLISKYPYIAELGKCLETIYRILGTKKDLLNFEINDLIMYLINSIPIPEQNMRIQFFIPYCNNPKIELQCPKLNDISIMNSNFMGLFKYLSTDNIVLIFRLLLSEKKILFIHDDYTELTNITNSFITLLYPFQWIHPYIPIMSTQMLKYLETFLPFLNGIHISLMNLVEKIFKDDENNEDEVFLVYIKTGEINISSIFKKNKNKFGKYVQNNIPVLPYEKDLKKDLKILEASKKQIKNEILENKFREAFINIFVKMFHDYEKYIMNLDEETVFNKVLFMKNITNKDEKTDQFYNEFLDSQLFQQFSQNSNSKENNYFRKKIKEYKDKENKMKKSEKGNKMSNAINKKNIVYLAAPYIGLTNTEKNNIDTIIESYKVNNDSENSEMKNKILEDMAEINPDNYKNSKCFIYLNPEKKEAVKEEEKKNQNISIKMGELTEKQLDAIKDNIKDIVVQIFKSQIAVNEVKTLKKKVFRDLETSAGRSFFISLITNKNNNIISLQENSFLFLEDLIQGILNSTLKCDETDQLIEEISILIMSTRYFEIDIEENSKDKNLANVHIIMFQCLKKFLSSYNKITQKNFWKKWYDLEIKKTLDDNSDENDIKIKTKIILEICKNMIFFEISKSNVKNVVEYINKIIFGEGTELFEKLRKEYIQIISKARYISAVNNL